MAATIPARLRRTARAMAVLGSVMGLSLLGLSAPAQAANSGQTTHYIVFVNYYSDPALTILTGSRTWSDCPGEEGTWGWGGGTYHTTEYEACP